MSKKLKVYGWTGRRLESKSERNRHAQTREIVAAFSAAEVMRRTGLSRRDWEHSGCETGNDVELAVALADPGVVYWAPLNDARTAEDYHRVEPGAD